MEHTVVYCHLLANHLSGVGLAEEHVTQHIALHQRILAVVRTGDGQVELTVLIGVVTLVVEDRFHVEDLNYSVAQGVCEHMTSGPS